MWGKIVSAARKIGLFIGAVGAFFVYVHSAAQSAADFFDLFRLPTELREAIVTLANYAPLVDDGLLGAGIVCVVVLLLDARRSHKMGREASVPIHDAAAQNREQNSATTTTSPAVAASGGRKK